MMSIRLIAIDLDGTALRRDGTSSPRTVTALSRAAAARPGLGTELDCFQAARAAERFILGDAAV